MNFDPKQFDKSTFTNQPYIKRVEKPWGYELHWVPEGMPYMGKILHIDAVIRIGIANIGDMGTNAC